MQNICFSFYRKTHSALQLQKRRFIWSLENPLLASTRIAAASASCSVRQTLSPSRSLMHVFVVAGMYSNPSKCQRFGFYLKGLLMLLQLIVAAANDGHFSRRQVKGKDNLIESQAPVLSRVRSFVNWKNRVGRRRSGN